MLRIFKMPILFDKEETRICQVDRNEALFDQNPTRSKQMAKCLSYTLAH